MRVLLKMLAWTLGGVVILIATLLIYLRNADLNTYESLIEQVLSDAIGLQVDFDGRFELHFGRTTTISAENISLINTELATNAQVLNVRAFDLSLETWSLIRRPIVVESLAIGGATIDLYRAEDGRGNWQAGPVPEASEDLTGDGEPPDLSFIVFRRIDLEQVSFSLEEPDRSRPVEAQVQSLTVIPDDDRMLDLALDGTIGDYALRSSGTVGPLPALLSGADVSVDVQTSLALMDVSVVGSVGNLETLEGLSVSVEAIGPEIGTIIDAFVLPPFAEGAFAIRSGVQPDDAGNTILVEGNIGTTELSLNGQVDNLLGPEGLSMDFAMFVTESAYIAGLFGIDDATRAAFDVSGGLAVQGGRYEIRNLDIALGRSQLNMDGWVAPGDGFPEIDMRIQGAGPNLAVFDPFIDFDGIPADAYDIDGRLMRQGDAWLFEDVNATVGEIRFVANGRVNGTGDLDNRIVVNVTGPDLSAIGKMAGVEQLPAAAFDVTGDFRGANGGIRIETAEARVRGIQIDVSGFLSTAEAAIGTTLNLRAHGPSLGDIAILSDVRNLPEGDFDISGSILVERSEVRLTSVSAQVDDLTLSMDGSVGLGTSELAFDIDAELEGTDLSADLPYPPLDRLGQASWRVSGNLVGAGRALAVNDLHALVENLDVEVDAALNLSDLRASDHLEVHAVAPDASVIQTLGALEHIPEGPFVFALNVDTTPLTYRISDSTFQIGDVGIDLDGEVGKSRPYSGNDISVFFDGPSLREIGLVFGDPYLANEAFSLEAHFDGTETGFTMETFDFTVGISEIGGAMSADVSGNRPVIDLNFNSPLIDLRDRIPRWIDDGDDEEQAAALEENRDARVFSDEPLDLPWAEVADVKLDIDVDRLLMPTGELTDFKFDAELADGNIVVDRLAVTSPQGGVNGQFSLVGERGEFSVSAALDVDDVRPPALAAEGLDPLTVPPIDVDVRFDGSGESLHDIVAAANGHVFVFIDSGQVAVVGSGLFSGGLIEGLARTINPLARARTFTKVDCGIADIDIVGGVARFEQVSVQSEQLTVVSSGNINLDSERLRLTVRTFPREGLGVVSLAGIVNPFIRVAGTLGRPSLEIDPASSATSAGVAVATGGLSVLARGMWDRIRGGSDMCRNLPRERPDRAE